MGKAKKSYFYPVLYIVLYIYSKKKKDFLKILFKQKRKAHMTSHKRVKSIFYSQYSNYTNLLSSRMNMYIYFLLKYNGKIKTLFYIFYCSFMHFFIYTKVLNKNNIFNIFI